MKKTLRVFSSIMLAVCMAFAMVIICTAQVNADSRYTSNIEDMCFVGQTIEVQMTDNEKHHDITIKSLYTSSVNVVDVFAQTVKVNNRYVPVYTAKCKNTGRATISIEYLDNTEGKIRTYAQTVVVAPYPKWAKTFEVNGEKVKLSKKKNKFEFTQDFNGAKPKIKLITKDADGINYIDYVKAYAYKKSGGKGKRIKLTKKMLKNGTEFDFPDKYDYVVVKVGIYTEYEYKRGSVAEGHLDYYITLNRTGKYKLTYKLNGGTNSPNNPSWYNGKVKLKNPKKKGYTFKGWYADKKFKKRVKTVINEKKTLYAKWKARTYTITYKGVPEGAANPNKTSYTIEKTFTLKDASCDGYDFDGWYSDEKLTKKITEIQKGRTGNMTIYSKWTAHNAN